MAKTSFDLQNALDIMNGKAFYIMCADLEDSQLAITLASNGYDDTINLRLTPQLAYQLAHSVGAPVVNLDARETNSLTWFWIFMEAEKFIREDHSWIFYTPWSHPDDCVIGHVVKEKAKKHAEISLEKLRRLCGYANAGVHAYHKYAKKGLITTKKVTQIAMLRKIVRPNRVTKVSVRYNGNKYRIILCGLDGTLMLLKAIKILKKDSELMEKVAGFRTK